MTDMGTTLWDKRMLMPGKVQGIASYYPLIGRGNIEREAVSGRNAARGLRRAMRKSLVQRVLAWLDL